jgi:hypothetical protein
MTKYSEVLANEAADTLRDIVKPGMTVYTSLRQVSSNGMSRHIEVLVAVKDRNGNPVIRNITRLVARACGYKVSDKTDALVVGGAGMDMGFSVVYNLSRTLYRDGVKCTGKGCSSNDHSNDFGAFDRKFRETHPELYNDLSNEGRTAYCSLRSEEYDATEKARYSKRRVHKDGGYAIRQSWV